jgi:[acyl-carrier-protein] S-malonyltransferase
VRSVENVLEVGPGKVLCGLMKQIDRSRSCVNVQDEDSLQKAVNHFSVASGYAE